jgi:hypothetical protein
MDNVYGLVNQYKQTISVTVTQPTTSNQDVVIIEKKSQSFFQYLL